MSCSSNLKRKIGYVVSSLRKDDYSFKNINAPSSVNIDDIVEDGCQLKRRRIVLNSHGCSVATCTMCPLPDESVPVEVHYESCMANHYLYNRALSFLDKSKMGILSTNNVSSEVFYGERKIYDLITNRQTCQMLSYTWTMFRLGLLSSTKAENQVLTVIDKKYMRLENRVFEMVPKEFRDKIFYRFF